MAKTKQEIIDDMTAHIEKRGGAYTEWYVGTGAEVHDLLFSEHKVLRKGDRWIHRRAGSAQDAREVKNFLLSKSAVAVRSGSDDTAADAVYAYKKASHTKP